MSISVVLEQMIMIALLIALGFVSYKKGILNDKAGVAISAIRKGYQICSEEVRQP